MPVKKFFYNNDISTSIYGSIILVVYIFWRYHIELLLDYFSFGDFLKIAVFGLVALKFFTSVTFAVFFAFHKGNSYKGLYIPLVIVTSAILISIAIVRLPFDSKSLLITKTHENHTTHR